MKDRKLLFFDIDGTLLSEKTHTVPQSAKEALKKAKENGHLIFINTGRPISTIDQEIHDLNPDGYICGCGTYITYHDKVIYHHQLSKERCKEIASLIKKYEIDAVLEQKIMFILILILKILLFKEFKKDIQIMVSMFQQVKIQIFPLINLLFGLIMISKTLEIIFLKILILLNVVKKCGKSYQRITQKLQVFKLLRMILKAI